MIDDFVRPPSRGTGNKPNKPADDDFFPDLSQPAAQPQPTPLAPSQSTQEPTFITPEEAAQKDLIDETIDLSNTGNDNRAPQKSSFDSNKPKKERIWKRFSRWFQGLNKKQKALVIIAALLLLGGIGGGIYALVTNDKPAVKPAKKSKQQPKPTTVASNLTGLQVKPEINEKPVTGVMIENSLEARPQAGLIDAGVVFEAIAEGGITRFLALYQDTAPESVGPVRSARPYYIDWLQGFDATFAHVGGSPEALQQIRNENIKDLDQAYNANYYQRVTDRYAPHNVFTSIPQLNELEKSKGYGKSKFQSLPRKKDAPSAQPNASVINLAISSARFNVQYNYDAASNTYLRTLGGQPHVDANSSKQIAPKVVIAMVMDYSIARDGVHSVYNTIGSGQVYVFQDGTVTEGTWQKTDKTSQITFTDVAGNPIKLNAGQTWITTVNAARNITYQP